MSRAFPLSAICQASLHDMLFVRISFAAESLDVMILILTYPSVHEKALAVKVSCSCTYSSYATKKTPKDNRKWNILYNDKLTKKPALCTQRSSGQCGHGTTNRGWRNNLCYHPEYFDIYDDPRNIFLCS